MSENEETKEETMPAEKQESLTELRRKKFQEAYDIRFEGIDISIKPTRRKDRQTGAMVEGKPLAYLNWAVAQRTFLQIYPDGIWGVIETPDASPLWNINGYGMLKLYAEALGRRVVEYYPLMEGGMNDAMKIEAIDGRDVSDSIQRGFTKLFARFGIGLYIYEGKLDSNKTAKTLEGVKKRESRKQNYQSEPQAEPTPQTQAEAAVVIQQPPKKKPTPEEIEEAAKNNQDPPTEEQLKELRLLYAQEGEAGEAMFMRNEMFLRSKSKKWMANFINGKKAKKNG